MRRLAIVVGLLSVGVLAAVASAEPGEVTRHLLTDQATMLDLGMFRLELDMQNEFRGAKLEHETGGVAVRYDYDRDLVVVYIDTVIKVRDNGTLAFQQRPEWIAMAKVFISFAKQSFADSNGKRAASHFQHRGFVRGGVNTDEQAAALAKRIVLRVDGFALDGEKEGLILFAESGLMDEDVIVGEVQSQ